jgi:mono/diheme cytochrome c family protein
MVLAAARPGAAPAQVARPSGLELYRKACANCHGPDGTGGQAAVVGLPIIPPDFTESRFASREPAGDWAGVVTHGGPIRGFDRLMPAFGDALTREEIDLILEYVQTLYQDKSWPRGEFNLPLALGTEKAFPEDEALIKTTVGTGDAGSVMSKLIYEKRFGSQTQIEIVVPFGWQEVGGSDAPPVPDRWEGGIGDLAIGLKRVLFHDLGMGTITSFTLETILPTGNEGTGFGKGYTVFEPFLTLGQLLPGDAFVQVQTGVELPTDQDLGENEGLFRAAVGRTFTVGGEWGRAISPMLEFLGAKELEGGAATWDIMPEVHFTLNQRQHVMANVGVRFPLTEREGRKPQIMFLLLWDWFDGGLLEGW